jgi:hypothetical protein
VKRILIVAIGKKIIITYSDCVFIALIIQHAKSMRRIIFSSMAFRVLSYFATLSDKRLRFPVRSHEDSDGGESVGFPFLF